MKQALILGLLLGAFTAWAAEPLDEARKAFAKGNYAGTITNAA